jgi:oligoendopeptidase F
MERLPWRQIEHYYAELAAAPLSTDTLTAWLTQWSRLSDLVEETQMRLWIECMRDTTAHERAERRRRFADEVGERAAAFDQHLERRLAESGIQPASLATPMRNLRARASQQDGQDRLLAEERSLVERYQVLHANQMIPTSGAAVSTSSLASALEREPRAERERCWRILANRRLADRGVIDELWQTSMRVRQQIAAAAGYRHYRDYQWHRLMRFDYSASDCTSLATATEDVVVPAATVLWEFRRKELGVSEVRPWDTEFSPVGSRLAGLAQEAARRGRTWAAVFAAIAPEFGGYFETLEREGLLDLDARPGKADLNFSGPLQASRRAFVFTQLTGGARDPFLLFHEAGHAFHAFEMFAQPYHQQRADPLIPIEFAELAAMTMEFVAPQHLHEAGFCSEQQQAQLQAMRLERAVMWWLPACARIDTFQHWAYDNPAEAMNTDRCDQQWADLSRRYFPWIVWGDDAASCAGDWRHVLHIFTQPFYFVEYALATIGALQISAAYSADRHAAITRYRSALRLGTTATVPELFRHAGATFTFDIGSLRTAVDAVMSTLEHLRS